MNKLNISQLSINQKLSFATFIEYYITFYCRGWQVLTGQILNKINFHYLTQVMSLSFSTFLLLFTSKPRVSSENFDFLVSGPHLLAACSIFHAHGPHFYTSWGRMWPAGSPTLVPQKIYKYLYTCNIHQLQLVKELITRGCLCLMVFVLFRELFVMKLSF